MKTDLRVLFLAAEADPFVKIGGLGDVAGSLPPALRALSSSELNVDVRVVIPFYQAIQRQDFPFKPVTTFYIEHANGALRADVFQMEMDGVPFYLINGDPISSDAPVYTPDAAVDGFKFTFFSLAALELTREIDWAPDILHANDWHTSPAVYALSRARHGDTFFRHTAAVLGLHNLPYLGIGAGPAMWAFGLPPTASDELPEWARHVPLALGLISADKIIAVSPHYAEEILTPEFGSGLHEYLQAHQDRISGILNGLDGERWNPATDIVLPFNYNLESLSIRQKNKTALQQEFDLNEDTGVPLFAMINRMDYQKGVDLVPNALRQLANPSWQAIILGTGDPALEAAARRLEAEFPNQVRAAIRFDAALSRRIYGGADALMIPSRYEPCGLTQMIAMRYGCVPVARATGGLADTIIDGGIESKNNGYLFEAATPEALAGALSRVLERFSSQKGWETLQLNGMRQDFSWERSAQKYLQAYQELLPAGEDKVETEFDDQQRTSH
jgi:starch synthase